MYSNRYNNVLQLNQINKCWGINESSYLVHDPFGRSLALEISFGIHLSLVVADAGVDLGNVSGVRRASLEINGLMHGDGVINLLLDIASLDVPLCSVGPLYQPEDVRYGVLPGHGGESLVDEERAMDFFAVDVVVCLEGL